MANNWFGGPTTPSDPSTFNYDVEAQKLQRQRAAAQALQQMGMTGNQGQFIKSGDFTGFVGGNTAASTIARALAGVLSVNANSQADDQQKQLASDSQDALAYAMDPRNTPAGKRAAAAQAKTEADAQMQREMNRTTAGGERVNPNAEDAPAVETFSVDTPTASPSPLAQAAAKAIASTGASKVGTPAPSVQAGSISTTPGQSQSVLGGPDSFGSAGGINRKIGKPTNLPTNATGSLSPDDIAFAAKMFGGASASSAGNAVPASPAVTSASKPQPVPPVPQPMPQQAPAPMAQPAMPSQPIQQPQPAPAQMPSAPPVDSPAQQAAPVGDPRSLVDQAAANAQPTPSEQVAQLQQIARTGPMGQQMASAMMNSQFSREWGEIKNADGATIGVYNKRDPSQLVRFPGTNSGTKTIDTAQSLVKSTDYTNPEAMQRLNQNLASLGQPPMSPQQVAGLQQTAAERATHQIDYSKAQGELAKDISSSQNNISNTQKAISDAQTMITLAAKVGSKYPGIATMGQLFSRYAKSDPDVDQLKQLYATNTLATARDALQGQGRLNQQEFGVFEAATPNMQTNPAAVARLLGPSIELMQKKNEYENAILNERTHRYQQLGGDPNVFSPSQAPAQVGASTGRAPGNYNF